MSRASMGHMCFSDVCAHRQRSVTKPTCHVGARSRDPLGFAVRKQSVCRALSPFRLDAPVIYQGQWRCALHMRAPEFSTANCLLCTRAAVRRPDICSGKCAAAGIANPSCLASTVDLEGNVGWCAVRMRLSTLPAVYICLAMLRRQRLRCQLCVVHVYNLFRV